MDNGNFVLNALESLSGGDNLIGLRGKSAKVRRFEDVERIRRNAQLDFKVKENEIIERINRTKTELQEIWGKKDFERRQTFTTDELSLIAGIRKRLDAERKELGEIRRTLNAEINAIDTWVKLPTSTRFRCPYWPDCCCRHFSPAADDREALSVSTKNSAGFLPLPCFCSDWALHRSI